MSDFASSLPVRSEADGVDAKVIVKVIDGSTGGVNQLQIDTDKNAHVEMHGNKPDGTTDVVQQLSEEGRANGRGDYNGTTNTKPASAGLIVTTRSATPSETTQTFRPSGVASSDGTNANALDVAIRDEAGNPFTASNPMPVTWVDSEGTEVNDYNTSVAVAVAAVSNHDYTVTAAKTLKLSQIAYAATGKARIDIQVETGVATGIFTTRFVFFNSTANPSGVIPVNENITVAAGVKVRVVRTNKDLASQDLYSTICGHEI